MKNPIQKLLVVAITLLTLGSSLITVHAQNTVFTYQGRLTDGANPANGTNYGMVFYLYDAPTNGTQLGNQGIASVTVSNGLFTVPLNFGDVFNGNPRWLEILVQKNGSGFTTLSPRQPITPTPYAIYANSASNVSGTISASQLSGAIPSGNLPSSANFSGSVTATTFSGNGANVTNVNAASLGGLASSNYWQLGGNRVSAGQFIGSTNNQPLLLKGSFVGIGRSTPITSSEYFGIDAFATSGYGGMYLNTTNATGWPFYGYAQGGVGKAWHYVDGGDTNKWKLAVGGSTYLTVTPTGLMGVGTANPSAKLEVAGQIKITGGSPGAGKILLSDSNGLASWQSPSALSSFFGQSYSVLIPEVIDNTAYMEIAGIMQGNVVVINGPGLDIQRVTGFSGTNSNDQPGSNMEYPFVFEYSGADSNELQNWYQNFNATPPINDIRAMSLFVKRLDGTEVGRWNLLNMAITRIEPGTDGRKRYTLQHTLPPNNKFGYERTFNTPSNVSKNPATDQLIEIEGVIFGVYPTVQVNYTNRTITMVFDYTEAGDIYTWLRAIADDGIPDKRATVLITQNSSGVEISRRNFFGTFPISFQYVTGFGQVEKMKEKIVLSFDYWEQVP